MKRPGRRGSPAAKGAKAAKSVVAKPAEIVGHTLERALDPLASVLKNAVLRRAERDRLQFAPAKGGAARSAQGAEGGQTRSKVSSLAVDFPAIPRIGGVEMATARAGLHRRQRDDLLLMRFSEGTACAGVFTRHQAAAAPVDWSRRALKASGGEASLLVVNAGCANAFTGKAGADACRRVAAAAARRAERRQRDVVLASTGRMGVVLDDAKVIARLPDLAGGLAPTGWREAACAMMSTDTFPKGAYATARIDGREVRIAGIAKGAGMLAPDMATALAVIVTDAAITPAALQTLIGLYVRSTFNCVTIDGDPSTNDTCLLFATGASKAALVSRAGDRRLADFRRKLEGVMLDLAWAMVRDGEGASKFIKVSVTGAESPASARRIARDIAESQGVKAALSGGAPEWGRVVVAAGRSGEPIKRERMRVSFGPVPVMLDGATAPGYREAVLRDYLAGDEIEIAVEVGVGRSSAQMWTCDLTKGYVEANQARRS